MLRAMTPEPLDCSQSLARALRFESAFGCPQFDRSAHRSARTHRSWPTAPAAAAASSGTGNPDAMLLELPPPQHRAGHLTFSIAAEPEQNHSAAVPCDVGLRSATAELPRHARPSRAQA